MKKSPNIKPFTVEFQPFGCNVYYVHCSYKELCKIVTKNDPSVDIDDLADATGAAVGNLLWVSDEVKKNSVEFIANLTHEAVHLVDMLMDNLGLEGSEVRAYSVDYIVKTILEHTGMDKALAA